MIKKEQVKQEFERRYTSWLYFDCVIFGTERVEIKVINVDGRNANLFMLTMPIRRFNNEPSINDLQWSRASMRPYNPKKRLVIHAAQPTAILKWRFYITIIHDLRTN